MIIKKITCLTLAVVLAIFAALTISPEQSFASKDVEQEYEVTVLDDPKEAADAVRIRVPKLKASNRKAQMDPEGYARQIHRRVIVRRKRQRMKLPRLQKMQARSTLPNILPQARKKCRMPLRN